MAPTKYTPLTLHFSDAVTNVYPRQVEKLVANDGSYEYFRALGENEQKDILWRSKIAKALVEKYLKNAKGGAEIQHMMCSEESELVSFQEIG